MRFRAALGTLTTAEKHIRLLKMMKVAAMLAVLPFCAAVNTQMGEYANGKRACVRAGGGGRGEHACRRVAWI